MKSKSKTHAATTLVRIPRRELGILRQLKKETGIPMRELIRRSVSLLRDTKTFVNLLDSDFRFDMEEEDQGAWDAAVGKLKAAYRSAVEPGI